MYTYIPIIVELNHIQPSDKIFHGWFSEHARDVFILSKILVFDKLRAASEGAWLLKARSSYPYFAQMECGYGMEVDMLMMYMNPAGSCSAGGNNEDEEVAHVDGSDRMREEASSMRDDGGIAAQDEKGGPMRQGRGEFEGWGLADCLMRIVQQMVTTDSKGMPCRLRG
ncbi:hypothetical protein BDQ12DRAFT_666550 [Crucibulum laeve]|uniref:Uncharacterized protein n=1 Tax=Crucibulum laeve TaxID=68775 RepID=A0A5C3M9Y8_9AGAR|nr:hypothetical protein BDQ12DRAFT_131564 [Crucibulum laeve]TFK37944.1 hypothetical protein BDQ12DRAFT_666550 [Crucibulum laeve]